MHVRMALFFVKCSSQPQATIVSPEQRSNLQHIAQTCRIFMQTSYASDLITIYCSCRLLGWACTGEARDCVVFRGGELGSFPSNFRLNVLFPVVIEETPLRHNS